MNPTGEQNNSCLLGNQSDSLILSVAHPNNSERSNLRTEPNIHEWRSPSERVCSVHLPGSGVRLRVCVRLGVPGISVCSPRCVCVCAFGSVFPVSVSVCVCLFGSVSVCMFGSVSVFVCSARYRCVCSVLRDGGMMETRGGSDALVCVSRVASLILHCSLSRLRFWSLVTRTHCSLSRQRREVWGASVCRPALNLWTQEDWTSSHEQTCFTSSSDIYILINI